jgi:hypothetical protein
VVAPASDGRKYEATVVRAYKYTLLVKWEDGATASAPREDCELHERAPRVRITDEDKRERRREQQELRSMAQHDTPALLLLLERRAMAQHDKPRQRAAALRAARPLERRDWYGDITAVKVASSSARARRTRT